MQRLFTSPAQHTSSAPTLELVQVGVRYENNIALEDIAFQAQRGEQIAIVGPNGAGKSTLFNVITGIIKPAQGTVRVYGSGPRGHICVGYVPQRNRIDWRFPVNVREVVMMGRTGKVGLLHRPRRADWQQVDEALARVGMLDFAKRQIGELSGGQQQRVFLARALAQEAELLLLDEPLNGLDMPSQEAILRILGEMRAAGMTLLIATHDLNQAAEQCNKMMLLNRRVIAFGTPAQVMTPDNLLRAYGGHLHVIQTVSDGIVSKMVVADSCCGGGEPPVAQIVGSSEPELAH